VPSPFASVHGYPEISPLDAHVVTRSLKVGVSANTGRAIRLIPTSDELESNCRLRAKGTAEPRVMPARVDSPESQARRVME